MNFRKSKVKSLGDLEVKNLEDTKTDYNILNSYKYRCDVKSFKNDIFQPLEIKELQYKEKNIDKRIEKDYHAFKHKYMTEY